MKVRGERHQQRLRRHRPPSMLEHLNLRRHLNLDLKLSYRQSPMQPAVVTPPRNHATQECRIQRGPPQSTEQGRSGAAQSPPQRSAFLIF